MYAISATVSLFLLCCVSASAASTYLVEERSEVCFFRFVEEQTELQAKVFVFKGGNLDIGFSVRGPFQIDDRGNIEYSRSKLKVRHKETIEYEGFRGGDAAMEEFSGYEYKFKTERGEYEICLSNDRSFAQAAKHVMLDISEVEGEGEATTKKFPTGETTASKAPNDGPSSKPQGDLAVITDEMKKLDEVFKDIKNFQLLELMRLTERKNAAEDNHASMVQGSVVETVVLMLVGIGQIIFVRKWFSGKGTLLKQWS